MDQEKGKILQFPDGIQKPDVGEQDAQIRMDRIRAALARINSLMEEIRGREAYDPTT